MSPGLVAYVNIFPMKEGRSCSMVSMMMSYIFSWPLGGIMCQVQSRKPFFLEDVARLCMQLRVLATERKDVCRNAH